MSDKKTLSQQVEALGKREARQRGTMLTRSGGRTENLLKIPSDREYTMSPEWKKAYSALMQEYSTFEVKSAIADIKREGRLWSNEEKAERIQTAKKRIEGDKNRWKTESLPSIQKNLREWRLEETRPLPAKFAEIDPTLWI
jgi:hypothetical protein